MKMRLSLPSWRISLLGPMNIGIVLNSVGEKRSTRLHAGRPAIRRAPRREGASRQKPKVGGLPLPEPRLETPTEASQGGAVLQCMNEKNMKRTGPYLTSSARQVVPPNCTHVYGLVSASWRGGGAAETRGPLPRDGPAANREGGTRGSDRRRALAQCGLCFPRGEGGLPICPNRDA